MIEVPNVGGVGDGDGGFGKEFSQFFEHEDVPCCDGWKQYWVSEVSPCLT